MVRTAGGVVPSEGTGECEAPTGKEDEVKKMSESPNLLCVGKKCARDGYRFCWEPYQDKPECSHQGQQYGTVVPVSRVLSLYTDRPSSLALVHRGLEGAGQPRQTSHRYQGMHAPGCMYTHVRQSHASSWWVGRTSFFRYTQGVGVAPSFAGFLRPRNLM